MSGIRWHHQLIFDVEAASFLNWEGKRQVRDFAFNGDLLSHTVRRASQATERPLTRSGAARPIETLDGYRSATIRPSSARSRRWC